MNKPQYYNHRLIYIRYVVLESYNTNIFLITKAEAATTQRTQHTPTKHTYIQYTTGWYY